MKTERIPSILVSVPAYEGLKGYSYSARTQDFDAARNKALEAYNEIRLNNKLKPLKELPPDTNCRKVNPEYHLVD